jgi:predicted nucleic acid-binding Zn ribbon protein
MPIFEFKCERCGKVEQRFYQSFKQMCLEKAVRCIDDGSRMERIASAPAFKVEGFSYANGYGVKS